MLIERSHVPLLDLISKELFVGHLWVSKHVRLSQVAGNETSD